VLVPPVRGLSLIVSSGGEDRKFDATRPIARKLKGDFAYIPVTSTVG